MAQHGLGLIAMKVSMAGYKGNCYILIGKTYLILLIIDIIHLITNLYAKENCKKIQKFRHAHLFQPTLSMDALHQVNQNDIAIYVNL